MHGSSSSTTSPSSMTLLANPFSQTIRRQSPTTCSFASPSGAAVNTHCPSSHVAVEQALVSHSAATVHLGPASPPPFGLPSPEPPQLGSCETMNPATASTPKTRLMMQAYAPPRTRPSVRGVFLQRVSFARTRDGRCVLRSRGRGHALASSRSSPFGARANYTHLPEMHSCPELQAAPLPQEQRLIPVDLMQNSPG